MNDFAKSLRILQTIAHPKAVDSEESHKASIATEEQSMIITLTEDADVDQTQRLALIPSVKDYVAPKLQAIANTVFSHIRLPQTQDQLTFHVSLARGRYQILLITKEGKLIQRRKDAYASSSMQSALSDTHSNISLSSSFSNSVETVEDIVRLYFEQPGLDTSLWKYITVV